MNKYSVDVYYKENFINIVPCHSLQHAKQYAMSQLKQTDRTAIIVIEIDQPHYPHFKNVTVYLAGPITDKENYNQERFDNYTSELKKSYSIVYNPLNGETSKKIQSGELKPTKENYNKCLSECMNQICNHTDVVAFMPGWEHSPGAMAEFFTAKACGLEMIFLK